MPNVAIIIGEGGSGGAIAIATANRVLMLEHAIYSVISPEGAASILWRDAAKAQDAATNMKITAQDLLRFGVIDADHPRAARRRAPRPVAAMAAAGEAIAQAFGSLKGLGRDAASTSGAKNSLRWAQSRLKIGTLDVSIIVNAGIKGAFLPLLYHAA